MAEKIALINMKGGVGKSTLTVNLAWHFARVHPWDKKVLVVDNDPQFNASQYLLGASRYQSEVVAKNAPTVWDVYEQGTRVPGITTKPRDVTQAIRRIVEFPDGSLIDLLPSQLELNYTLKNPSQKEHRLRDFLKEREKNYDLIIIDCAPTESVLTTATYLASDKILVPVKPEYLSTIGLPLLVQSMNEFRESYGKTLELVGVIFNGCSDYSPEETKSKEEVRGVASKFGWFVFDQEVPYSRSFPKGAREGQPIFRTSYSRGSVCRQVNQFAQTFAKRIGL